MTSPFSNETPHVAGYSAVPGNGELDSSAEVKPSLGSATLLIYPWGEDIQALFKSQFVGGFRA